MDLKNKAIVNIAVCSETSWYINGQNRLRDSIIKVSEDADLLFTQYENLRLQSVYEDKVLAIKEAAEKGYKKILWLDCSITAIASLQPIWDKIEQDGYYLYESGSNCAITCNDRCLSNYGLTRDEAEKIKECASNVVGINLESQLGFSFYKLWVSSLLNKSNLGEKWPSKKQRLLESEDKRFKYHRNDQSCASLSAGLLGLSLDKEGNFVRRFENKNENETIIFILKGGE
jgi:hypothetical protein